MSGTELLAASLVISAASASAAAYQASQQEQATSDSKKSQREAAAVQEKQLAAAAGVERLKRLREAEQIKGRQRVLAAEAGVGPTSYSPLENQANYDLSFNLGLIDENLANQQALVRSGLRANLAELSARTVNPVLAGFQGGLSGLSTGLQISSGISAYNRANPGIGNIGGSGGGPGYGGNIRYG